MNPAPHTALVSEAKRDRVKVNASEFPFSAPVIAKLTAQKDINRDDTAHKISDSFVFIVINCLGLILRLIIVQVSGLNVSVSYHS